MKKLLVLALVLLALCATGVRAAPADRTVEKDYVFLEPRYGVSPLEAYLKGIYEFKFKPQPGERTVSISVEDLVVEDAPGILFQYASTSYSFCGSTEEPIPIVPHKTVVVRLVPSASCDTPHVMGIGTHVIGTVTATFSR